MNMKERLLDDMKAAMRDKDTLKKELLQICRAAILQIEVDQRIEMDDAGVLDVLSKEYKKRQETLKDLGDREDIITKYKAEMAIIEQYLPKELTESEILEIVNETIAEVGAVSIRDMGKLMQALQPKIKGRADGKLVNQFVKKQLEA